MYQILSFELYSFGSKFETENEITYEIIQCICSDIIKIAATILKPIRNTV